MMLPLIAALALAPAKPTVLIYQDMVIEFTDKDNNVLVAKEIASGLDAVGKVAPVSWEMSEPAVVAAIRSGAIRSWEATAKKDDVFKVSRAIGADYVVICKVLRKGGELEGDIQLYRGRGGRTVWDNNAKYSIIRNGKLDIVSGSMTIASTWVAQLDTIPFKDLPASRSLATPDPGIPTATHTPSVRIDSAPLASGRKALREGKLIEAVVFLNDAVDADPMSAEPRLALIEALQQAGHPFLAAGEAARAYELMPDRSEFLIVAAQSWIDGGQTDRAFEKIQEALAKDPKNAAARTIFGDMMMGRLDFERAAEQYTAALAIRQDPETLYKRAQAYALTEEFSKSVEDLEKANKLGLSQEPEIATKRYRNNVGVLEPVIQSMAVAFRNLLKEAQSEPGGSLKARTDTWVLRASALMQYLDRVTPPLVHVKSHEQRGLAMNLLYQAGKGLHRHLAEGGQAGLGDADLLQIEAMRELAAAKSRFESEHAAPTPCA